jgi:tellurite resistance-related uncharacterized protein
VRRFTVSPGVVRAQWLLDCGHEGTIDSRAAGLELDCAACDRREIPDGATPGRRTPVFTAATTPKALLAEHRTNAWAVLQVEVGSVAFSEQDPPWARTATAEHSITIVPGRSHKVAVLGDTRYSVQFFELPVAPPSATVGIGP